MKIVGYAGADGHHAGNVARNVAPYLTGQEVWATERHARVFRNAGGTWFIDQALAGDRHGSPWSLSRKGC